MTSAHDIARVADVIATWQRRHPNVMDRDPAWAAQNLAIDLAHAGEVRAELPAPYAEPAEPLDPHVWEVPASDAVVEATHDGLIRLPGGTVLDPDEAEQVACVIAAAAARARRNQAAYHGEDGVV